MTLSFTELKSYLGLTSALEPQVSYHLHSEIGTLHQHGPSSQSYDFIAGDQSRDYSNKKSRKTHPSKATHMVLDTRDVSVCKAWGNEKNSLIAAFGNVGSHKGPCDIVYRQEGDQGTSCHLRSLKNGYFTYKDRQDRLSCDGHHLHDLKYHSSLFDMECLGGPAKLVCEQLAYLRKDKAQSVLVPDEPDVVLAWTAPLGDGSNLETLSRLIKTFVSAAQGRPC